MTMIDNELPLPNGCYGVKVLSVQHYTDRLFHFTCERPLEFRFRSGEFVMISLPMTKPIWRAYSIASPNWMDNIEFFSIKVHDGPLTQHLQKIKVGDVIWMRRKSTGTLVLDALKPGRNLYLFATGTGVAPFASLIREPETFEKFDRVILIHTTRLIAELEYTKTLVNSLKNNELLHEIVGDKLLFIPSTTREESAQMGRITDLIHNGVLHQQYHLAPLDPALDRAMICGSMAMLTDLKAILEGAGFIEGSNSQLGDFVIEKAFVSE